MVPLQYGFYDELHKVAKARFPFKSVALGAAGGGILGSIGLGTAQAILSGVAADDEETSRAKLARSLRVGAMLGSALGGVGTYRAVKAKRRIGSLLKRKLRLLSSK